MGRMYIPEGLNLEGKKEGACGHLSWAEDKVELESVSQGRAVSSLLLWDLAARLPLSQLYCRSPSSIVGPHLFLFLSQSSFQIQLHWIAHKPKEAPVCSSPKLALVVCATVPGFVWLFCFSFL